MAAAKAPVSGPTQYTYKINMISPNARNAHFVTCGQRGSVIECLTRARGAAGSNLTGVTVLCP